MTSCSGAERNAGAFSGMLLFRAEYFSFGVFSFSKQFRLFAVWPLFLSIILFLLAFVGPQILGPVLFESLGTTGFPVFLAVFFCLPTDFLLFRALVPGLLHRLWFVLRHGFLYIRLTSFRSRTSSRPFLTGSLLLSAAISIVFTPTFFCIPRFISFILPLTFFCLNRSLPFVVDFLQTIECAWSPMSAFCLANVFNCVFMSSSGFAYAVSLFIRFNMAFWSRFMGNVVLLGRNEWVFLQYSPGKWFLVRARVPSCNGAAGTRRTHGKRRIGVANVATAFCKRIWQRFLHSRGLWTR